MEPVIKKSEILALIDKMTSSNKNINEFGDGYEKALLSLKEQIEKMVGEGVDVEEIDLGKYWEDNLEFTPIIGKTYKIEDVGLVECHKEPAGQKEHCGGCYFDTNKEIYCSLIYCGGSSRPDETSIVLKLKEE